jgi:hypothetical protein
MTDPTLKTPPRFQARMAGVFAWIGTTEGFAIWVRSRLVVDSDAAATAHNILAHERLYRWGFVGDVISCVAFIIYTLLLYDLFRPVSRRLALLAAVSNLVGEAIQLSIGVFLLAQSRRLSKACGIKRSYTLDYTPESSRHFHSQETSDEQGPLAGTGEPDSPCSLARPIIGFQPPLI